MGQLLNIINPLHKSTERDFLSRMINNKVECSRIARQYGKDYWDGERCYGYGGYRYDGRWKAVAESLIKQYDLKDDAKILDVGCGKAFLLYELRELLPNSKVVGIDISDYALINAKPEVKAYLHKHDASERYPYQNKEFDLVISITTLHNLRIAGLKNALSEIERVGKNKYLVVESYRNEQELFNLQCWALTCESFFSPEEWSWIFAEFSYTGDYEFIYF
ncbi:MAG: class I SAM-dependent methyltransferase [Candidatus Riflebacteria bacterium]|nr:class I SAM-dependent methyltransferase [Candidatus Riflebacteria bacterium]